jgi:hypothetical protein
MARPKTVTVKEHKMTYILRINSQPLRVPPVIAQHES